ncbi:T9SS type A sorting domain-containing protein [Hymenobacter sp. B1770]|uniref:T9SS type A sorting domain-containing protein n=1 Tax=Hymenobacter sp. B1770 TaxID=1718788 RepID=UPI003CF5E642
MVSKDISTEAYPNPTGRDATINFSVPKSGRVVVEVYNSIGSRVATLYDGKVSAGEQRSVVLKGSTLPSGTYTYRVISNGKTKTSRISLVK